MIVYNDDNGDNEKKSKMNVRQAFLTTESNGLNEKKREEIKARASKPFGLPFIGVMKNWRE